MTCNKKRKCGIKHIFIYMNFETQNVLFKDAYIHVKLPQMVGIYTKSMIVSSRGWAEEIELGWGQLLSVLFNLFYINATEANMINY